MDLLGYFDSNTFDCGPITGVRAPSTVNPIWSKFGIRPMKKYAKEGKNSRSTRLSGKTVPGNVQDFQII